MRTARLPTVSRCIPYQGGGQVSTYPPGHPNPRPPGHPNPRPRIYRSMGLQEGLGTHPPGHPNPSPTLDILTPWKGPGTRDSPPPVDRQTPVKTLPSHNFIGRQ